ncbi:MAG: DNA polymerase III subunit delta' [Candidatus Omnitrophota bacterium]
MSFSDILAQPVAVKTFKGALAYGRLSGAYLLSGPEGVGKRFAAREFAKAINCEALGGDACGRCASCRKIDAGTHPDFLWIEPKTESAKISIEAIRELKKEIALRPWEGKRRIAVIVEAECSTEEAQNAFLKMLEETPKGSLIFLTSVKQDGILPTVLSRCKVIRFGLIPTEKIRQLLQKERGLSSEAAQAIAKLSHGSLGKALAMKEDFLERREWISQFLEKAFHADEEKEWSESREALLEELDALTGWYRDVWMVQEGLPGRLLFHESRLSSLKEESSHWRRESVEGVLQELLRSREMLEQHVNPKLLLSVLARRIRTLRESAE